MTIRLAEGLIDDVVAYFGANFQDKVDALNLEYEDDISLEAPAAYYVGEKSLLHVPRYPAVFVLVPRTTIPRFRVDYIQAIHDLVIGVIVIDTDTEDLRRKLYRYVRAFIELLIEGQLQNGFTWALGTGPTFDLDYSPIYTSGDSFIADAQVIVSMQKRQMEMM